MADEEFRHPRLAAVYDSIEGHRADLDGYAALVQELGGRRVLDVGCGTGTFALMLAERGCDVIGVDIAPASVAVARAKDVARRVQWVDGDARDVSTSDRDVAVMTGNVAQAITDPTTWQATLRAVRTCLRPGGHLVFESRDPRDEGWQRWNRAETITVHQLAGVGVVTTWTDVLAIDWPLVTFQPSWVFERDRDTLTSRTTIRFRSRQELEADLMEAGYRLRDVRDAADRPGREMVFLACVVSG